MEGWFGGIKYDRVPKVAELDQAQLELIEVNAAINSQVRRPTCLYIKILSPQCIVVNPENQLPFIFSRVGSSLLGCIKNFSHPAWGRVLTNPLQLLYLATCLLIPWSSSQSKTQPEAYTDPVSEEQQGHIPCCRLRLQAMRSVNHIRLPS